MQRYQHTVPREAETILGCRPVDWEYRPAIVCETQDTIRAYAVLDEGEPWTEVDWFEVCESGFPISWREFNAVFSDTPSILDARWPESAELLFGQAALPHVRFTPGSGRSANMREMVR